MDILIFHPQLVSNDKIIDLVKTRSIILSFDTCCGGKLRYPNTNRGLLSIYWVFCKYVRNFVIWCMLKYLNFRKYSLLILKNWQMIFIWSHLQNPKRLLIYIYNWIGSEKDVSSPKLIARIQHWNLSCRPGITHRTWSLFLKSLKMP